jgi:5-methyltetrahydropteroyltriglutamate--homocysteine methyltransferase
VDEANLPGNPDHWPLAAKAINTVFRKYEGRKAVHLCFGNYGGQAIQTGTWGCLIEFLNALEAGHVLLECAHRPEDEMAALRDARPGLELGVGVIDVKVNHVESPEEVARRIERAEKILGPGRVRWVHPDCGFWMLKRSVADRKIAALVKGRNVYLGHA